MAHLSRKLCLAVCVVAVCTARGAFAAPRSAIMCLAIHEPFVGGVSEAALIAAVRARVARNHLRVVACGSLAQGSDVRIDLEYPGPGRLQVSAHGERVSDEQELSVDESQPAEVIRQAALAVAELVRPTLIAWLETDDSSESANDAWGEAPKQPPPAPSPAETTAYETIRVPQLYIGTRAGARFGGDAAAHVELAPEIRYGGWHFIADGDGDFSSKHTTGEAEIRFESLELGLTVGHDVISRRLWLGVGGQGRLTRAALSGRDNLRPSVSGWSYGARLATGITIWRRGSWDFGVSARVSGWYHPIQVLYAGAALDHQAHVDVIVAPYLAIRLD